MQIFIIGSPIEIAQALDKRRLNKQIIECGQILAAIEGTSKAWANHPCVLMYREHAYWLEIYMRVLSLYQKGIEDGAILASYVADEFRPPFHTEAYFNQMKRGYSPRITSITSNGRTLVKAKSTGILWMASGGTIVVASASHRYRESSLPVSALFN